MSKIRFLAPWLLAILLSLISLVCHAESAPPLKLPLPQAYQMVIIEGISETRRTFVTKTGKRSGFVEGMEVSFNTENIGVLARAKLVTGRFTVWEMIEKGGTIPFRPGQTVVMNRAKEDLWHMVPKQVKESKSLQNFTFRANYGIGIHESFSRVTQEDKVERNEYQFDILYENHFGQELTSGWGHHLSWALGIRLEREAQVFDQITVVADRWYILGELTYHFPRMDKLYDSHFYAGLTIGAGYSTAFVDGDQQVGVAYVLPGTRLGIQHDLSVSSSFFIEGALDSVAIRELVDFVGEAHTNGVNAKLGVGLKYHF